MKIGRGRGRTGKIGSTQQKIQDDVGSVEQGKNCQAKGIFEIGADSREETGKSLTVWRWEVLEVGGGRGSGWKGCLVDLEPPDPGSGTRSLSSRPPPPGQLLIENLAVIET